MVYAARLSVAQHGLSVEESERIEKLCVALNLPVAAPGLVWDDLRAAMAVDKKTIGGLPKFVLTDRIGHVDFGCEVPEELLKEVWDGISQ
jgi:3-dehydroquinate synthetase